MSGIWHDFRITTVEDQQKAALPLNEITETLWYDKSLLIDSALYNEDSVPRRWKVSKVNRISPNGICILTCAQEIFDEHRDYIEKDENGKVVGLWANYFDSAVVPKEVSTEEQEAFTVVPQITVSGKPQIRIGGSAKTFTITYVDDENNIVEDWPIGDWSFTMDGEDATPLLSVEQVKSADNKVRVKFLGDDNYIGKVLTVRNGSGDDMAEIQVEILPL